MSISISKIIYKLLVIRVSDSSIIKFTEIEIRKNNLGLRKDIYRNTSKGINNQIAYQNNNPLLQEMLLSFMSEQYPMLALLQSL